MRIRNLRRIIALIIIVVSLLILIWGIWPLDAVSRTLRISPQEMQLPTPESYQPILQNIVPF